MLPAVRPTLAFLLACAVTPLAAAPGHATAETPAARAAGGACRAGYVSLTFDDGPSDTVTPRLVRILERAQVPATFFMVGQRVAAAPETARLVARSGFLVANHSYAHAKMTSQSQAQVVQTLRSTDAALRRAGTVPTNLMRPPYGAIDDDVRAAARRVGLVPVLWNVDSQDWRGGSTATIAASILSQLRPHQSNVVLQHDGVANSPASVAAVPRVVAEARRRGFCFTALDEQGQPGFPTPEASLTLAEERVPEGARLRWRVRLDKPTARSTSVSVQVRSRVSGAVLATVPATVAAGRTGAGGSYAVPRDGRDERPERLDVSLVDPHDLRLGSGRHATALVLDRDPAPRVDGVARSAAEPATEPQVVDVRFRLSRASGKAVSLVVETRFGTAGVTDLEPLRTRVRLAPGTRSFTVPVTLLPDTADPAVPAPAVEGAETFRVLVTHADNARRGKPAVVTVRPLPHEEPAPPGT